MKNRAEKIGKFRFKMNFGLDFGACLDGELNRLRWNFSDVKRLWTAASPCRLDLPIFLSPCLLNLRQCLSYIEITNSYTIKLVNPLAQILAFRKNAFRWFAMKKYAEFFERTKRMFDRLMIVVRFFPASPWRFPWFKAVATSKHEGKHPAEMPDAVGGNEIIKPISTFVNSILTKKWRHDGKI